jgi:hypothetical protein
MGVGGWHFLPCDQVPSFYTPFSIFGVEMLMEVEGFSIPLLALKAHGVFPSFLLSLSFFTFSANLLLKLVSSLSDDSNWFELILLFPWTSF